VSSAAVSSVAVPSLAHTVPAIPREMPQVRKSVYHSTPLPYPFRNFDNHKVRSERRCEETLVELDGVLRGGW
jgi:hypothetical protein